MTDPAKIVPMEARTADALPAGSGWHFEPKWDGFRCLVLREARSVRLTAKSGKPLGRFFPEVVDTLARLPPRTLLDGELVIPDQDGGWSFEALQMRLHPAATRIARLARETPATFVAFDCLMADGRLLVDLAFAERRAALVALMDEVGDVPGLMQTPGTGRRATAQRWLAEGKAGFDGVVAKRLDLPYRPGERAMVKVKRVRTADCVVGGFRYEQGSKLVGSLLLGLYDAEGRLNHVGFTSAIAGRDKPSLTRRLEARVAPPGFTGDAPGGPSRWATARSVAWQPLAPELVVEVAFDHVTGGRFRHGTRLVRWRPDKAPGQCTMDQIG